MPIVSQPRWRDLSSWGVWLIDALVVVLLPRRTLPIASYSQPTLLPAAAQPAYAERSELWQSPYDPFPWFSRRLGARWQYAWFQVHHWLVAVRAWLMLAARLWNCRTLAEVIAELTRRCIARYLGALHVLHLLLEQLQVRSVINRCCRTRGGRSRQRGGHARAQSPRGTRALYRVMDWLASTVVISRCPRLNSAMTVSVARSMPWRNTPKRSGKISAAKPASHLVAARGRAKHNRVDFAKTG